MHNRSIEEYWTQDELRAWLIENGWKEEMFQDIGPEWGKNDDPENDERGSEK